MSTAALVAAVAAITVGSRVLALAFVPPPRGRLAAVVDRLPAPLFAVLAAVTLLGGDRRVDPAVLGGALAALATMRCRSLLITVITGLAGAVAGNALA
jgi:Branched-chain amino acid transport protein (AzlD)